MKKLILILFLTLSKLCFATVYYISPTGSDSNPGTITQPFKTFNRIGSIALVAGDIVYIRAGTYLSGKTGGGNGFNISGKSGTSTNPITISAYPADFPNGGRVVLDCRDYTGTASFFGANINNCPWFVFRGIRIIGVPQRVAGQINPGWLLNGCSNTILDNCEADHCGYSGFMLGNSNNVTYKNCDSHSNDNPFDSGVQKHGGADGFARTSSDNTSTNTTYEGCRSWFNADDGWDCFDTNGTIDYDSCWSFWNGYKPDVLPLTHCVGSECWGDGNGFKMGGSNTNVTGSVTRFITNCFAFQNANNGFDQNAGHFLAQAFNNTAYANGVVGFALAYYSGLAMVLRNNISFQNQYNISQTTNTNSWVQTNNTWNSGFTVSASDFASLTNTGVDGPRQANGSLPSLNFLHLASTSKLIDAGVNVGLPYSGTAPDLGAYQYGQTTTPPPPTTYYNVAQSKVFTKNDCTTGTGSQVTYTVPAGKYSSTISQADADSKATADINANGQTYANTNGTCSTVTTYYNVQQSKNFTRNNCGTGYTGSTVTYTVPSGKYSSTISQTDANAKATADINANGQNYANTVGTCTKTNCSFWDKWLRRNGCHF